ncbi:hypothetical protein ACLOJK_027392 [Asimina triloba]
MQEFSAALIIGLADPLLSVEDYLLSERGECWPPLAVVGIENGIGGGDGFTATVKGGRGRRRIVGRIDKMLITDVLDDRDRSMECLQCLCC